MLFLCQHGFESLLARELVADGLTVSETGPGRADAEPVPGDRISRPVDALCFPHLTLLSPRLKALYHEEGDSGRKRFAMYSRYLTVPLAFIQGTGFLLLLEKEAIIPQLNYLGLTLDVITVTAGSILLMWIGELVTRHIPVENLRRHVVRRRHALENQRLQ